MNTVVGFIGPEYLYNGKQIIRAGLEDHFCGKLLGVPMGCDICYTNHAEADQDDMDMLLTLLGVAGINFIMGIPGSDDVMLNYQTTSFHDALYARQTLGLKPAPEFEDWLQRMGIFTQADGRIRFGDELPPAFRQALGRTGTSLPTRPQLDFQYAHAQARDAVHLPFDHAAISDGLRQRGRDSLLLHSAAADRHVYLQRPDLGRRLDEASVQRLREHAAGYDGQIDLAIVVADGLSALAVQRHTLPFLERLEEQALAEGWSLSPVVLVEQGRVAVADEIGELLRAKMSVILIGERPGLSSPDSLGLYFTWAPRVGLTDAYRNCISNVRLEGLSYGMAAHRLLYLMREACRRQLSGVNLKDEAEVQALDGEAPRTGNFLLARD